MSRAQGTTTLAPEGSNRGIVGFDHRLKVRNRALISLVACRLKEVVHVAQRMLAA